MVIEKVWSFLHKTLATISLLADDVLDLNGNEALCCHFLMGMKPAASDWSTISRIATR